MNHIKTLFLVTICLFPLLLSAKDIDKKMLVKYATQAYQMKKNRASDAKSATAAVSQVKYIEDKGHTLMALVNFEDHGFMLLSADDATMPVLGYSLESNLDLDSVAPATLYWIDFLKDQISQVKEKQYQATEETNAAWKALISGKVLASDAKGYESAVNPLIKATWNQNQYYNYLCPMDTSSPTGYDGRVPCGCVALAMSMIMYYYEFPVIGSGSHTYTSNYGTHTVNFTQQTYRYELMKDQLKCYNNEVAHLIYNAGVSVNMNYGPEGSGAYMDNCRAAMVNNFSFSNEAQHLYRTMSNTKYWTGYLKEMIDAKHPVLYAGCTREGCHAFICDGYDTTGLFHFNWGWGGSGNGYFVADQLRDGIDGYNLSQSIIKNLYPNPRIYPTYCSEKTIESTSGVLTDGSGNLDYNNNQNCTYIFAPQGATRFKFTVLDMATEEGCDSVSIWNGHPSKGQLMKTFSGHDCNGKYVDFFADTAYLTFKTNDNITDEGWRISYVVTRDVTMCVGNKIETENTGIISDGSGDKPYVSDAVCSWIIRPKNVKGIEIKFNKFDLSLEDHLDVYDMSKYPNALLDSYSGNELPETKTYETVRLKIVFMTDNYLQGDGFEIEYKAIQSLSSIDGYHRADDISVYPNPAQNVVNVEFSSDWHGECHVSIVDMAGRLLKSETLNSAEKAQINVADMPSGFYIVHVSYGNEHISKKLVIQK